jgi:DNA-binding transcriptional regulator YiaG
MTAIDIAVPAGAQAQVQRAIGQSIQVRMVGLNDARSAKMFVSTLAALPAQGELSAVLTENLPIVVLARGTSMVPSVLAQRLAQLWRLAGATIEPLLTDAASLRRILLAMVQGAEAKLIATAALEADELVVWSCEPREFRCRVSDIAALKSLPKSRLKKFSVSTSGSRLRWPDEAIDLNLDTFHELSDPEVLEENQERFRREAKNYADAIKTLRKRKGLKQGQIAGLSERQVRRLESGEVYPHASTLEKLAFAHDVSPPQYVRQLAALATHRELDDA